jgi:hypothetical protein
MFFTFLPVCLNRNRKSVVKMFRVPRNTESIFYYSVCVLLACEPLEVAPPKARRCCCCQGAAGRGRQAGGRQAGGQQAGGRQAGGRHGGSASTACWPAASLCCSVKRQHLNEQASQLGSKQKTPQHVERTTPLPSRPRA